MKTPEYNFFDETLFKISISHLEGVINPENLPLFYGLFYTSF